MRKPMPLQFPVSGVVENAPYSQQPPGTTPDALNVRSFDSLERRNRGGQRIGMSKLAASPISAGNQIQLLEQIVRALDLVQSAAWSDKLVNPASALSAAFNHHARWDPNGAYLVQSTPSSGIRVYPFDGVSFGTGVTLAHSTIVSAIGSGDVNDIAVSNDGAYLIIGSDAGIGYCTISPTAFGAITEFGSLTDVFGVRFTPDSNALVYLDQTGTGFHAIAWTGTALGSAYSDPGVSAIGTGGNSLEMSPTGEFVVGMDSTNLYMMGFTSLGGFTTDIDSVADGLSGVINRMAINPAGSFIAWGCGGSSSFRYAPINVLTGFGASTSEAAGIGDVLDVKFDPSGNYLGVAGETTPHAKIYQFGGGLGAALTAPGTPPAADVQVFAWSSDSLNIATATDSGLEAWAFLPAAINPTARETRLVAVSGGNMYQSSVSLATFALVSGGSSAFDETNPALMADTAFQKLFVADGISANYQYLDFADTTLKDWAGDITDGSLPQGTTDTTLGCRFLAVYRGRVVLSGLKEEPQNWFMSRAGDPFDFDYSPTVPDATQAVAGNNSEAGELGDIVTALAPYQDDLMVMGGANSVWVMRGDPAAGGQIDNIVRGIGIVGPHAWCFDDVGNFYFFAVNGLYRISAGLGTQPELISKNKLDTTFADLDVSAQYIRMEYDPIWQGVHIFNVSEAEPSSNALAPMHYFWDSRNNGFWPDQYPASIGPTATLYFNDDNPERSGVVLGGWDSYLRQFDDGAADDDGTAITSRVQFAAENPGLAMADSKLSEIHINLDRQSDDLTLNVYSGQTVEDAVRDANLRFARTLVAGKNNAIRQRARGAAIVFEVTQSATASTWAYENGLAIFETQGKTRRRRQ